MKSDAVPCSCTLSQLIRQLTQLRDDYQSQYEKVVVDTRRSVEVSLIDQAPLKNEVAQMIQSGELVGDFWKGDWTKLFGAFVMLNGKVMCRKVSDYHDILTPAITRLADNISAARIIEEVGSFPLDWTAHHNLPFPSDALDAFAAWVWSSESARQSVRPVFRCEISKLTTFTQGNEYTQASSQATSLHQITAISRKAVDMYELATLIDPSNFEARLSSAAKQLQLANHGSEYFQSVLARRFSTSSLTTGFTDGLA